MTPSVVLRRSLGILALATVFLLSALFEVDASDIPPGAETSSCGIPRFFAMFPLLSVFMVGMILSGKFFKWPLSRKPSEPDNENADDKRVPMEAPDLVESPVLSEGSRETVPGPVAAAIALALHLHLSSSRTRSIGSRDREIGSNAWSLMGRSRMMNDRLSIYNR